MQETWPITLARAWALDELFSNTGEERWGKERPWSRALWQEQAEESGPAVLTGAWLCRGENVSAGQASAACEAGQC